LNKYIILTTNEAVAGYFSTDDPIMNARAIPKISKSIISNETIKIMIILIIIMILLVDSCDKLLLFLSASKINPVIKIKPDIKANIRENNLGLVPIKDKPDSILIVWLKVPIDTNSVTKEANKIFRLSNLFFLSNNLSII
jgi:hypothetical protein